MKGIILAGGSGTRLYPITKLILKCTVILSLSKGEPVGGSLNDENL